MFSFEPAPGPGVLLVLFVEGKAQKQNVACQSRELLGETHLYQEDIQDVTLALD